MVKLSEIELPVILEKKLLFGPGKWNDWNIEEDEVLKSIHNTEWNKKTRSLFYSHEDDKAEKWVGSIANEFLKDGKVYGDLKICDADLAFKLTDGEAPFAVSAGIKWPAEHRDPIDFSYRNFSLVVNPGVHNEEIYINFADKKTKNTFNEAKLIYSKANFNESKEKETPIEESNEKKEETKKVDETLTEKSNLNIDERRLNANMVNEEKTTETIEEKTEVKSEEKEVKEVEEVKEKSEDESKEETTDADFSELKTKLDEAISRIKVLEEKQANFEETKSEDESKEEVKEEEKVDETKEEVEAKEDESKEETEDTVADFKKIANKLDRVANALENKAAPMSTAEFSGTKSKKESVTNRLTSFLSK